MTQTSGDSVTCSGGIKVILKPTVRLMSYQRIDPDSLQEFLVEEAAAPQWMTDAKQHADAIPEIAGRLCYMSFAKPRPGGNAAYLDHIKEVGHGSVLEHSVFGLLLTGVSRSLTHELVRHRAGWGFSELSQRYVDCSDVSFVLPPAMIPDHDENSGAYLRWRTAVMLDLEQYEYLTEHLASRAPAELSGTERRKWARQAARSVLPNCAETKIFVTANARAWRHFLEMRGSKHADMEIRRLAHAVFQVLYAEAPGLFGDYAWSSLPDGTMAVSTPWEKV